MNVDSTLATSIANMVQEDVEKEEGVFKGIDTGKLKSFYEPDVETRELVALTKIYWKCCNTL